MRRVRIILVGSSHPGNIGAVARAMKTMGLTDLRLVAPRCSPQDPQALARSASAREVLENHRLHETVMEAVEDCQLAVATSARDREIAWPTLNPRETAHKIHQSLQHGPGAKVALVFGREDVGLSNEELSCCHLQARVPASEEYSSLNLAMAVQIFSYEVRMALLGKGLEADSKEEQSQPASRSSKASPMATAGQVNALIEHFESAMMKLDFYGRAPQRQVPLRLRRMFQRLHPDVREIGILRGFLGRIDALVSKLPADGQHLTPEAGDRGTV